MGVIAGTKARQLGSAEHTEYSKGVAMTSNKSHLKTIKVVRNIWGNHACYVGSEVVMKYGTEFDAQSWLDEQFSTGQFKLSPKSELKPRSDGVIAQSESPPLIKS